MANEQQRLFAREQDIERRLAATGKAGQEQREKQQRRRAEPAGRAEQP